MRTIGLSVVRFHHYFRAIANADGERGGGGAFVLLFHHEKERRVIVSQTGYRDRVAFRALIKGYRARTRDMTFGGGYGIAVRICVWKAQIGIYAFNKFFRDRVFKPFRILVHFASV